MGRAGWAGGVGTSRAWCVSILLVLAACSPAPTSHEPAAAERTQGGIPAGWAFPSASVAPTVGTGGMVTTTDRVASEVGAEILRRGGNAVDAAIATHFALAVVNPEAGNIGGGGFMVVQMADGRRAALDFREKAPRAATRDMFLDANGELTGQSQAGHLASGVPGSVAGMWEAHQRFGTRSWAELVQPAITLADGIVMHDRLAQSLLDHQEQLRKYPATAAAFLPNGSVPRVGERFEQRDLAGTLRRIAREGMYGFYKGRTAELIEAEMRRGGGLIDRGDLAAYTAVWREPLVFAYRSHTIVGMPPPSSGGVAIAEMLNILEGYDLPKLGFLSRDHAHVLAEASKRAILDRNTYLADPDFVPQPVAQLISRAYGAKRRKEIGMDAATASQRVEPGAGAIDKPSSIPAPREGENTTHFSVVDATGNAVAVTTTLNSLYGSFVTVAGAGFLMNDEMDDFTTKPGAPNQFGIVQGSRNAIAPGKRMLSSMAPTIVLDGNGGVQLVTGSPGGPTIITTVVQIVSDVIDFGMNVGDATAAPRVHHQHLPDVLYYEHDGLRPDVIAQLTALGHHPEARRGFQGDAQSIAVLPDGRLAGVSDPRRGGAAVSVSRRREVVQ